MSKPVGPYTPIVRAGEWLVVSGQLGLADGKLLTGGLEAELRQAVANLAGLLASEGASLTDVVKTTVFLRHLAAGERAALPLLRIVLCYVIICYVCLQLFL